MSKDGTKALLAGWLLMIGWFLMICLGGPIGAWAQGPEFSADQILTGPGGTQQSRLYCKNDRWRLEFTQLDKSMVHIVRLDKKVAWMVIPEDKVYTEMPCAPDSVAWAGKMPGELERKPLGEEALDGHPALKYQVRVMEGEFSREMVLWISKELKVPVKTATLDGKFGTELRNIQAGPQPDDLFEIPGDFKQISPSPFR